MDDRALRAALVAIRAQVDAVLAQLAADEIGAGACEHPAQARRDLSVMGQTPRYECRACGAIVAEEE